MRRNNPHTSAPSGSTGEVGVFKPRAANTPPSRRTAGFATDPAGAATAVAAGAGAGADTAATDATVFELAEGAGALMGSNSPSGWVLTPPTALPLSVTMSGAGAVIDGCRGRDATAAGPERPARTADLSDPAALGEVEALTAKSVGRSGWALIASPGSVEAAERVARPDAGTGEAATTAAAPPRAVVATNVAATGAVMVVGESVAADAEGRGAARGARVAGRAARSERPEVGPADTDDDPASAEVSAAPTPTAQQFVRSHNGGPNVDAQCAQGRQHQEVGDGFGYVPPTVVPHGLPSKGWHVAGSRQCCDASLNGP